MYSGLERWKNKVAVVTGAASGIGKTVAERLVKEGMQVVGIDLVIDGIEELAKTLEAKDDRNNNASHGSDETTKLYAIKADVTKDDEVITALKWATDNLGPPQILVNAAGIAKPGSLLDCTTETWRQMMDVNIVSVAIFTREFVKVLKAHDIDQGHVINLNSITGHMVPGLLPEANIYPASKHAVTGYTKSIRHDLRRAKSSIKVTSLSPGFVDTMLLRDFNENIQDSYKRMPKLKPDDVAEAIVYIISTPPHVSIAELTMVAVGEKTV